MNIYLTILISLSFSYLSRAQCSEYRTGKFVVKSGEIGDSYIKRTKKFQIEKGVNPNTGGKSKVKDKIIWIDDCTYKLIPLKIKDEDNIIGTQILTFKIIRTGGDYYVVRVSGIENFEMDVRVERR